MRARILAVAIWLVLGPQGAWAVGADNNAPAVSQTVVSVTPNSGAYSAGNCLGGVLTVSGMVTPGSSGGAVIVGATFVDPAHQSTTNDAQTIVVFGAKPTGTYTDHSACNIAAGDQANVVGVIQIASTSCFQDSSPSTTVCTVTLSLPVVKSQPQSSSALWFLPIVAATPTYGANTLTYAFKSQPN